MVIKKDDSDEGKKEREEKKKDHLFISYIKLNTTSISFKNIKLDLIISKYSTVTLGIQDIIALLFLIIPICIFLPKRQFHSYQRTNSTYLIGWT
jgi:uncharacterized membrane protein SpoIIM required for sporulation